VRDALAEARAAREAVMQMDRVGVARDSGEGQDIGVGHRAAEHGLLTDLEVFEIEAVHGRKIARHAGPLTMR